MQIEVEVKSFLSYVNLIAKATDATTINIEASAKDVCLSHSTGIISCRVKLPNVSIEEEGQCCVLVQTLSNALKGRKNIKLRLDKNKLVFEEGSKYSGQLETVEFKDVEFSIDKKNHFSLTSEQSKIFSTALKKAMLPGSFGSKTGIPVCIQTHESGTKILCYDDYYLINSHIPQLQFTPSITFGVMPEALNSMLTLADNNEYSISLENNALNAWGKNFKYKHQLIQMEDAEQKFIDIQSFLNDDILQKKALKIEVNREELKEALNNIILFQERGHPISFKTDGENLNVSIKGNKGNLNASISCTTNKKGKASFFCEWELLGELWSKLATDQIAFNVVPDRLLYIQEENLIMTCTLAGES